jgi:error-prone DNA polymerase
MTDTQSRTPPAEHYAELVCQSNFSFLTGASHPEELITQADFLGYQALAICDECSLAGVVRAHTAIKDNQLSIKQIVGSLFVLEDTCKVVLLAPCRDGYAELCRIITKARRRAKKGEYQLSRWDLMSAKHCLFIWLPHADPDANRPWGEWLVKHHPHRLWIGVQRHLHNDEYRYIEHCQALAKELALPITACGGVLMHNATRQPMQHTLTAIRLNQHIESIPGKLLDNSEACLRTRAKISKLFPKQWLEESVHIASLCHFELKDLKYEYPAELVPEGLTPNQYLRELVEKGKALRFPNGLEDHVNATIEKELTLIEELGYAFFFLTIHDVVMFAKAQGILYQGRGSAANSVVCYCLEITAVDPRQISVLFERFISKERNEPPDIDVDFEHERREEVIQYLYQKYGRERAALAATVISYRFKSAVRDVGKALGLSEEQLDFFIKNVNRRDRGLNWQAQIVELGLQPESVKGQQFIQLVNEIMGFPRHLSQHVGGFVISSGPLYELVPVENAAMEDRTIIQWDKDDLESLGLLKVDVLALGMLTAIRKCFDWVKRTHGRDLSIADITRQQDDPKVYQMIQQADTIGVFQIESRAQMSMLPRLKPATYYDLVIQIAIVRPGPIQGDMVHPFLKRRSGIEPVSYPSDAVKEVLERTMGVPIFQEQVIKLAMVAAGFTGGEADQLRRAMAAWKKNGNVFKFKHKLINGMLERGYEASFAERIFDQICGFGEYGFPESHSASFAILAYCSAWLKYYYPIEFYCSLLNSLPMGFYSPSQLIQDAQRHQCVLLPVCVNQSQRDHSVVRYHDKKAIRLGFRLVKGLSDAGIEQLILMRQDGDFNNVHQVKSCGLSKRDLESLASANAFRRISGDRYQARWDMMDSTHELPLFKQANQPQDLHQEVAEEAPKYTLTPSPYQALIEDYHSTGLSLDKHPIRLLDQAGVLGKFTRSDQLKHLEHKTVTTVIGVVTGRQSPGTAAGVTFFTLEDDVGNVNVVVWQGTARAQKQAYLTAKILKVTGVVEREANVIHVIAGKLTDMSDCLSNFSTHSRDFH